MRAEESRWKEKNAVLEAQVQQLQSLVFDAEQRDSEARQQLAHKRAEVAQLQTRCFALQDANETCMEHAKKASDEKERVQRDYLQVVYDLGKAQKQLNAMSKEVASTASSEALIREIDRLQRDSEALAQHVKALEVRPLAACVLYVTAALLL